MLCYKLLAACSLLPEGHILPKNMYEAQKLLRALKMPYEQIHAYPKGCILFRKEHAEAKYYPKCESSRFVEVESGDGQKRQLAVPVKVLRYLPPIPRIQRLFMTEEEEEENGADEEEEEDLGVPTVWQRGSSRLPDRPIPLDHRPVLRPDGKR